MKVLLNNAYGGFNLSRKALQLYADKLGVKIQWLDTLSFANDWAYIADQEPKKEFKVTDRADPALIATVEELGLAASSGSFCQFAIHNVLAGTRYIIEEYDGSEWIKTEDEIEWLTAV